MEKKTSGVYIARNTGNTRTSGEQKLRIQGEKDYGNIHSQKSREYKDKWRMENQEYRDKKTRGVYIATNTGNTRTCGEQKLGIQGEKYQGSIHSQEYREYKDKVL